MSSFQGIWVPVVTPFHQGQVDFVGLRRLVAHLLNAGVHGLVVCGTTGEAAALSQAEQLAVLDAVLELAPAEQVVMGLAGNHLTDLLDRLDEIQQRSLAAVLVPAPYYIRPSQAALESFFNTVAEHSRLPVILYDIPYRTGATLACETLLNITRHERIVAVKDCGGNPTNTLALLASGNAAVLAGEDAQIFTALCLGAQGAITAAAHIHPERFVTLYEQVLSQQWLAARATFFSLLPLIQTLFSEPNPAPVKTALALQGLIADELRAPLLGSSDGVRELLSGLGLARLQAGTGPVG